MAVGADRVCRLWRWTIDDLASSISCCSLRKARRAAYTVAYSLSLSPTSPGRTKAAARSVIAGCPECSASLSIFLLLCLPAAVSIEIKLSARRQLISVGVLSVVGVRAQVQAHAAERGYGGDLRGEINCVQVARILITTLQQTIYILRRSCIHESYIYSIYQYTGCHKSGAATCFGAMPSCRTSQTPASDCGARARTERAPPHCSRPLGPIVTAAARTCRRPPPRTG